MSSFALSRLFLASCGVLRAAKRLGPLHFDFRGFLVFLVPPGYYTGDYEAAAFEIMNVKRDERAESWVNKGTRVRLTNRPG